MKGTEDFWEYKVSTGRDLKPVSSKYVAGMEANDGGVRLLWEDSDLLLINRIFTVEKNTLDYCSIMSSICCALVTDLSVSKLTSV